MPENDRLGGGRAARTTPNRTPYIWVEDTTTGHRYDVLETALRAGMTPVKGYEPNYSGRPRPPKHRADLAGEPTSRGSSATTTTAGDTADSKPTQKGGQK